MPQNSDSIYTEIKRSSRYNRNMSRIVYLHGFASGPESRKALIFQERFKTLETPDLTEGNFEGLTISGQLGVIERLLRGEAAALIGSSMGGYLAALYAARHPEVSRVVLLAPAFGFARRWAEQIGPERLEAWRREGSMEVFNYREGRPVRLGYGLMRDALGYEDEPAFSQPGLIVHGLDDDVVPVKHSRRFAAGHPNVTLIEKRSGHELTDLVEEIWEEARRFLHL